MFSRLRRVEMIGFTVGVDGNGIGSVDEMLGLDVP